VPPKYWYFGSNPQKGVTDIGEIFFFGSFLQDFPKLPIKYAKPHRIAVPKMTKIGKITSKKCPISGLTPKTPIFYVGDFVVFSILHTFAPLRLEI